MSQAPTSAANGTARSDIGTNAGSFAPHLRAGHKAPNTIKSVPRGDRAVRLVPRGPGHASRPRGDRGEHVEAFIEDQFARLKPTSGMNPGLRPWPSALQPVIRSAFTLTRTARPSQARWPV
jgi:hypothetical protein